MTKNKISKTRSSKIKSVNRQSKKVVYFLCYCHLDHDAALDVLLNGGIGQEDEEACGEEENEADPKGNIDEVRPHKYLKVLKHCQRHYGPGR